MFTLLRLLLPALLPSWRFFDAIGPSPRIQYAFLKAPGDEPQAWTPYRPRPKALRWSQHLRQLIWNPRWNEGLYLLTCAERCLEEGCLESEGEILERIAQGLRLDGVEAPGPLLAFRLLLVEPGEDGPTKGEAYRSRPQQWLPLSQGELPQ